MQQLATSNIKQNNDADEQQNNFNFCQVFWP